MINYSYQDLKAYHFPLGFHLLCCSVYCHLCSHPKQIRTCFYHCLLFFLDYFLITNLLATVTLLPKVESIMADMPAVLGDLPPKENHLQLNRVRHPLHTVIDHSPRLRISIENPAKSSDSELVKVQRVSREFR